MIEEWRDIKGYEGRYKVSSLGRVLSLPKTRETVVFNKAIVRTSMNGRILKGRKDKDGYLLVNLSDGKMATNKKVHRLVAEAFIPPVDGKVLINHKNGNKEDNRYVNLEWCTNQENLMHAHHELYGIEHKYYNERPCVRYNKDMVFVDCFDSLAKAAIAVKRTKQAVFLNCIGKTKICAGYIFKFR